MSIHERVSKLIPEISFEFTRSRGAGGQHVNRTESAVILRWNLVETQMFFGPEKDRLLLKLGSQLNKEGELLIRAENFRDQDSNRKEALRRFEEILEKALFVPKKRIKTKPTKSSQRKRLDSKKKDSNKKRMRSEKW
ncbi:alternative ribosome rescue aminoacyl-tRNA hydrolase ArfB [Bdellovibrio sp. HCB337]|uniref:alternative ribosome rescue aminoacyl-tRNA hydrolase ArfB n=1 Tax=Bdellovibrio sp. HCB337 TaxID=3394358 RepID=UPI0039A43954